MVTNTRNSDGTTTPLARNDKVFLSTNGIFIIRTHGSAGYGKNTTSDS